MQELAIVLFVAAWLFCLAVDLILTVSTHPGGSSVIYPVLKLIVVLLCLIVLVWRLAHHGWLLGN